MDAARDVTIVAGPQLSADQLFEFYERNHICEVGFGKELAARVLDQSSLIVAALEGDRLVGIARAMFDGLSAAVMELSLDLALQGGPTRYGNGSLVEADSSGVGRRMGERFLRELRAMGATFIQADIVEEVEVPFYESLGFVHNCPMRACCIDERPYVR